MNTLMPEPPLQMDLWMNNAIQFGYIAFFSVSCPIMTLYGILINVIHVRAIYSQMTTILKRPISKEQANIGIWKQIFSFITLVSLFINIAVLVVTSKMTEELFRHILGESYDDEKKIIILVVIEHLVFFLTFLLGYWISDVPQWLRKIYQEREYRQVFHLQLMKQKELGKDKKADLQKPKKPRLVPLITGLS